MADKALMPARNNSLFLDGWPKATARFLSTSITRYSFLGKVKLSRTGLIFSGLVLAALAGFAGLATGLALTTVFEGGAASAEGAFLVVVAGVRTVADLAVVKKISFG